MNLVVVVTRDRQARSFRWGIRRGVNQPNELGLSRAEAGLSNARRAAERVFGPLTWIDAKAAGAIYDYIVEVAYAEVEAHAP